MGYIFFLLKLIIIVIKKKKNCPTHGFNPIYVSWFRLGCTLVMGWVGLNFFKPTMVSWVKKSPQSDPTRSMHTPTHKSINWPIKKIHIPSLMLVLVVSPLKYNCCCMINQRAKTIISQIYIE